MAARWRIIICICHLETRMVVGFQLLVAGVAAFWHPPQLPSEIDALINIARPNVRELAATVTTHAFGFERVDAMRF